MQDKIYDVVVVGGGINGCGIAADASGRGLSVLLCEQNDLASGTSSASTKLIHGGLRYLEHYEFSLVSKALQEREVLLQIAPHLAKPMRFVLPHRPHLRPKWLLRLGLFFYDHLSFDNSLPKSTRCDFSKTPFATPFKSHITTGFEYSDCWVDDSRLVIANALTAEKHGAEIFPRHKLVSAKRQDSLWQIEIEEQHLQRTRTIQARALVNASGPWLNETVKSIEQKHADKIKLVKGSHFIVKKFFEGEKAFILQNEDKRIVFVIPYLDDFALVGTTDVAHHALPQEAEISTQEIDYLLAVINQHFKRQHTKADIIWQYSGVRPLIDDEESDPSKLTRDYRFEIEDKQDQLPLITIYGGKLTTYRKLSEQVVNALQAYFPAMGSPWTASTPLVGGDLGTQTRAEFREKVYNAYPFVPKPVLKRYVRTYGTQLHKVIDGAQNIAQMGTLLMPGLYENEIRYLKECEWAETAEDVLWRRTKLGLYATSQAQENINDALAKI